VFEHGGTVNKLWGGREKIRPQYGRKCDLKDLVFLINQFAAKISSGSKVYL
jgi:hypothetical protein